MAQATSPLDQEQFSCTICLELLKEPVTIPCGHSYCRGCIENSWDQEANAGEYSCPQCRETFNPKPTLRKSTILADVVEKLKKTALDVALSAHCNTVPVDVMCDSCIDVECKAKKSCLVCLASYCETHLQPHYESPAFKKHKLVKATGNLHEKICSRHHKLLDVYCRNDQQFICDLCTTEKHQDHATVPLATARAEKQVEATQGELKRRVQEREMELQDLKEAVLSIKRSAQAAVEDSERIFTELIRSIKKRCSEVKQLIRDQEKAEVKLADKLLEQLEDEIAELKSRDAELEQLSYAEDHIRFLQEAHPNPGKPFAGIQTEAWLPYQDKGYYVNNGYMTGEKMLTLLQRAFELKLIFAVEATDGAADRVVLNGIPHARNM
ncbi:hypothetical protein GJAV_G00069290 [Gymnothorax javanicus]|nr:hypothetical protein GJAV_G00069290 [Gymnothorax javanicus]